MTLMSLIVVGLFLLILIAVAVNSGRDDLEDDELLDDEMLIHFDDYDDEDLDLDEEEDP